MKKIVTILLILILFGCGDPGVDRSGLRQCMIKEESCSGPFVSNSYSAQPDISRAMQIVININTRYKHNGANHTWFTTCEAKAKNKWDCTEQALLALVKWYHEGVCDTMAAWVYTLRWENAKWDHDIPVIVDRNMIEWYMYFPHKKAYTRAEFDKIYTDAGEGKPEIVGRYNLLEY